MATIVMSWSKCQIKIGKTLADDKPATSLTSVGTIRDKSSSLSAENGDALEMKATGGELVGYEQQPGTLTLTTTVIEPSKELYQALGLTPSAAVGDDIEVSSHVVEDEFTVEVTPKNIGAFGILAPKCSVSVQPTWDEETGHGLVLTFGILKSQVSGNYWYKKVKKKS